MGRSLFKLMEGRALLAVPQPSDRINLAMDTHRGIGYFGVQRVIDRLRKILLVAGIREHGGGGRACRSSLR